MEWYFRRFLNCSVLIWYLKIFQLVMKKQFWPNIVHGQPNQGRGNFNDFEFQMVIFPTDSQLEVMFEYDASKISKPFGKEY